MRGALLLRRPLAGALGAALLLLALAPAAQPARAAARTFDVNTTGDSPDVQIDGVCATSLGQCSLRAAIMEANAAPGSTINLPTGAYLMGIFGPNEDTGLTGDFDLNADMTIVGDPAGHTVVIARGGWNDRIFDVHKGVVELKNLTISGGNTNDFGGGVRSSGAILALNKVIVRRNSAANGGGVANVSGTLTIQQSLISGNTASGNGGGISNGNDLLFESALLTMVNSAVISNSAQNNAGGIATGNGLFRATNLTVSGNQARASGGGIHIFASATGAELSSVTITDNTADANGDTSGDGGGIVSDSDLPVVRNSIVAGNHDNSPSTRLVDCDGKLVSAGFNLLGSAAGCTISGNTTGNLVGVDPKLDGLTSVGELSFHMPLFGSPAIDGGNPAAPGSSDDACPAVDQRGKPRPRALRCDIGAVESDNLASQTIDFAPIPDKTLGDPPVVVTPTASSGLRVSITSESPTVCVDNDHSITLTGAGICTVVAETAEDPDFNLATRVQSFAVRDPGRRDQTLSFEELPSRQLNPTPFEITATASSGLPVRFINMSPTPSCQVVSLLHQVKLERPGICAILAVQDGDATFNPAPLVYRSFAVLGAAGRQQSISFDQLSDRTLGDSPFEITATASSGLPVLLSSFTPSVCALNGGNLTLLAAGTCSIAAMQVGDETFNPAAVVVQSFSVRAAERQAQTISFGKLSDRALGDPPFEITATASSGLPVSFSASGQCSLTGATLALSGAGSCAVTARQPGDSRFAPAPDVTRSFQIGAPAPNVGGIYLPLALR